MLELGYFPDVAFTNLPPRPEPKSHEDKRDLLVQNSSEGIGVSCGEAYGRFLSVLQDISAEIGVTLPLVGRNVYFLSEKKFMEAVNQKAQKKRYGEYIISNIVGYTLRFPDGTFDTYILGSGEGKVANVDDAVITLGHEYGHTIGPFLGPIEEEMKAYAFQSIFLEHAFKDKPNRLDSGLYPTRIHDVARNRIAQLRSRGFPMGAVIAHLTGENFGVYRPDSNVQIPNL